MTIDLILVLVVVATFSIVQSIFGMGILVFGTPTLLLIGHDFVTTLSYLLPASFAISLIQVVTAGSNRVVVSRYLYLVCLPGIFLGLWFSESSLQGLTVDILIGGTLLFSALVRLWPPSRMVLLVVLERQSLVYHFLMGLLHGLTNLGGAMLSILASTLHSEKAAVRYTIAHYYLVFSTIQMGTLAIVMGRGDILLEGSVTMIVSSVVYFLIGSRVFTHLSNPSYNFVLTVFIAMYGVALLFGP